MSEKLLFKKPVVFIIVMMIIGFVWARSSGITDRTLLGSSPGCTCHNPNPDVGVTVEISGPNEVMPGAVATFQVNILGPGSAAGVNIASDGGTLSPTDGSLQSLNGELTHTSPKTAGQTGVTFDFQFTAPNSEGTVTLAATGNSVNQNGSNSGDFWNHASNFSVTVSSASDIADNANLNPNSFRLDQNFPNPFNPATTIRFNLPQSGSARLSVFNANGELIQILKEGNLSAGEHSIRFDGRNLPSGVYFYQLQSGTQLQTRKMLLVK